MIGGKFDKTFSRCNRSDLVELIVHTTVFVILIVMFFGSGINTQDQKDMHPMGLMILLALGGLIGYTFRLLVKIGLCVAT